MTNPELLAEIERARAALERLNAEILAETDPQKFACLETRISEWHEDYERLISENWSRLEKLQERAA